MVLLKNINRSSSASFAPHCVPLWRFCAQGGGIHDLGAYTPQGLSGKYQFGTIDTWNTVNDTDLAKGTGNYTRWIPWLWENSYKKSAQTTRESWCPSAMVDLNGDLYTATFYQFLMDVIRYWPGSSKLVLYKESYGPTFRIQRFVSKNNAISVSQTLDVAEKLPTYSSDDSTYRPVYPTPGIRRDPFLFKKETEAIGIYFPLYGQRSMHSIFSPSIAQETSANNEIYVVISYPPSSLAYSANSILVMSTRHSWHQHLCLLKINKNNFSNNFRSYLSGEERASPHPVFHPCSQPLRATNMNYKLQPEWGSLRAMTDNSNLHFFKLAYGTSTNVINQTSTDPLLQYYRSTSKNIESGYENGKYYYTIGGVKRLSNFLSATVDGCVLWPRFQQVGNNIYYGATINGYQHCLCAFSGTTATVKNISSFCTKIESGDATSAAARYQTDFCILPNGNNPVACWLGFKHSQGWNNTVSWADNKLACVLYSAPISNFSWQTCQSNTLYVTDIVGGNGNAVNSSNTSASDLQRLYLNTQMIVPYTSASGRTYMIYTYCYPGKAKRIYLGYAPYVIDATSHVRLYTKREFRDKSDNTFGNFTDCSRIISMDLKNGHLWITFMNGDSTAYRYFHILAKDLVGE